LLLGGLERVVVVEDLAADELLELRRRAKPVDPELPLDELGVGIRPLARYTVDPERLDRAGDVDRPVVHRVAEARARVAADDLPPALHHEPGHRAHGSSDDDRAALLIHSRPRTDAAPHDEVPAAHGRTCEGATVSVDDHDPGHHVLAGRPADAARD